MTKTQNNKKILISYNPYLTARRARQYFLVRAFTLLELLLVIAVIAVLAGIILFALNPAQRLDDAKNAKYKSVANDVQKAINAYILDNGGSLAPEFNNLASGYYDICKNTTVENNCIVLSNSLIPNYLPSLPIDNEHSSTNTTGFKLHINNRNSITIVTYEKYREWAEASGNTLTEGLIAYYPLDEMNANTCTGGINDTCDKSGNGNDGAWTGIFTTDVGKYGLSGDFAPGTRFVNIGDPSIFDFGTNDFTVSAWAKRRTAWAGNWNAAIVGKWNTGAAPNTNEWSLTIGANYTSTDTYPGFTVTSGSNMYSAISPNTTNNNQWYHITGIRNGEYIYLYVDGNKLSTTFIGNVTINNVVGRTLKIGRIDNGSNGLDGYVDEVRIYNRALSSTEAKALYETPPGPIAHWKFDEGIGTTATDSSVNGYNGTLTNGPTWATGKYGNAINLDGINDYINANTIGNLTYFTVTGWFKQNTIGNQKWIGISENDNSKPSWIGSGNNGNNATWDCGFNVADANQIGITGSEWNHYTIVYDGTTNGLCYINGQLATTKSGINIYNYINTKVHIGKRAWADSGYFAGVVDDVRIYNYALTQTQIQKVMNNEI